MLPYSGSWVKHRNRASHRPRAIDKIFEKNLRFHVKYCSRGKVQYLVLSNSLLLLTIYTFWEEDWTLDYNYTEFWDFLKSYIVWQLVSQLVFTIFISNNHAPFHLLWKKHLVRYLQVPKYYERSWKFQKWHSWVMGHGTFNSNKLIT